MRKKLYCFQSNELTAENSDKKKKITKVMNCFYRQLYLLVIEDLVANFDSVDLNNY